MSYSVIKYGTPEPVRFTEKSGLELEAYIALELEIEKYDETRYETPDALKAEIFGSMRGIISDALAAFPKNKGVVRHPEKESLLAGNIASALAERGFGAEVCVRAFWLTKGSKADYAESFGQDYSGGVSPADLGPVSSGDQSRSGAAEVPAAAAATDKFCRMCGTRRTAGAKFCPECGQKYDS